MSEISPIPSGAALPLREGLQTVLRELDEDGLDIRFLGSYPRAVL